MGPAAVSSHQIESSCECKRYASMNALHQALQHSVSLDTALCADDERGGEADESIRSAATNPYGEAQLENSLRIGSTKQSSVQRDRFGPASFVSPLLHPGQFAAVRGQSARSTGHQHGSTARALSAVDVIVVALSGAAAIQRR